jgi:hypothetical protein
VAKGQHKAARQRRWAVPPRLTPPRVSQWAIASRVPPRLAVPALSAVLVGGVVVGVSVVGSDAPATSQADGAPETTLVEPRLDEESVSRSAIRLPVQEATKDTPAEPEQERSSRPRGGATAQAGKATPAATVTRADVVDHAWLTEDLNLWSGPGETFELLDVLPAGTKVAVTGEVVDGQWAEVAHDGLSRWVNADYLSEEKPAAEDEGSGGISAAECVHGSEVESGLTSNAVAVHRAVCAAFPEITSYGGLRADSGEHGSGLALDVMVTGSTGDAVAEFLQANADALGVSELIWEQRIWTVQRSSEGWRAMEDRGSTTANHYDHVHVTVYG